MANLNLRQVEFIARLKNFGTCIANLHSEAHSLTESYAEEYADAQDNDFGDADNLEETYNFDATDISAAITYAIANFINYWDGDAVETREYGKDIRRIK